MRRRARWTVAAAAALALAGGGGAALAAGGSGDDGQEGADKPISGKALERASSAALEHTGGGKVTETEVGDEEGSYEVEVTLPDGEQTDVHLDKDFHVLGSKADTGDESEARGDG